MEDGSDYAADRHADAVIGAALCLDDLIGGGAHLVFDLLQILVFIAVGIFFKNGVNRLDRHDRLTPRHKLAVAVLADHVGVHMARVNVKIFAQQIAQACGVERGAGADDLGGVEARELVGDAGHNVDGVGGDEEDAVKARGNYARHDRLKHLVVALKKLQPGFALLLVDARADHHHVGVAAVGVVAVVDLHAGVGERQAVVEVHRFASGAHLVEIDKHKLVADALVQRGVGEAHAHHAGADQHYFSFQVCHIFHVPFFLGSVFDPIPL